MARIPALFVLMSPSASQTIFMPALYTCIQNYTIKLYPPHSQHKKSHIPSLLDLLYLLF
jgi:hypothetical protein